MSFSAPSRTHQVALLDVRVYRTNIHVGRDATVVCQAGQCIRIIIVFQLRV
jgi:hypothetical protein